MKEIWKHVKEFEGYYQVSNLGRVRRIRPTIDCGIEVLNYLKPQLNKNNSRLNVVLCTKDTRKAYVLASLIHDTFFPERVGLRYKIKDGNPSNVRTDNFEFFEQKRWDGKTQNTHLTKMIITKHSKGTSIRELSNIFGLTENAIRYHINK